MSSPGRLAFMGIDVDFPFSTPYPAQKAIMAKTMVALKQSENALLESPTGTGKTLSLLASSLGYQTWLQSQKPEPPKKIDPAALYGEKYTELDPETEEEPQLKVYYTSRTHNQLSQVVSELKRKLPTYRPKMAILASRQQLCINDNVRNKPDIDAACRLEHGTKHNCEFGKSMTIPRSMMPDGEYSKYDIENLIDVCREEVKCPYFVTRNLAKRAEFILAPYNYILDGRIRGTMKIELANSVVIFDEGHNIEGICRDAASLSLDYKEVSYIQGYIATLAQREDMRLQIGNTLFQHFLSIGRLFDKFFEWFTRTIEESPWEQNRNRQETFFQYQDVEMILSGWTLNKERFVLYKEDMEEIISANEKTTGDQDSIIPTIVAAILGKTLTTLNFIYTNDSICDFRLIITDYEKNKEEINPKLELLCMSPGVAFRSIVAKTHSVIITSGTLSPLTQYESELRTKFTHQLSAKHVIDPSQVLSMIIQRMDGVELTSTAKSLNNNIYKKLGDIVLTIVQKVPDGILLFFPSGSTMRKCLEIWRSESLLYEIQKFKPVFNENSGIKKKGEGDAFKEYRSSINKGKGGLLISVCRGRVSEGTDFADRQARCVIIFGIPYPSLYAPEIILKRNYNDDHAKQKNVEFATSDGSEWYSAQAFRALSQAVGRCIRHKDDYGSIIMIDSRFMQERSKFPRWMQDGLKRNPITSLSELGGQLANFYQDMTMRFPNSAQIIETEINETEPLVVTHSDCLSKIVRVIKIDKTSSFNSTSSVLRKYFLGQNSENESQEPVVLARVGPGETSLIEGKKMNYEWSYEDGLAFEPICCTCGQIIGVHIKGSLEAPDKVKHIKCDWFFVDKCNVTQKSLSEKMSNIVIRPKVISMNDSPVIAGGQKTLSFA